MRWRFWRKWEYAVSFDEPGLFPRLYNCGASLDEAYDAERQWLREGKSNVRIVRRPKPAGWKPLP